MQEVPVVRIQSVSVVQEGEEGVELLLGFDDDFHLCAMAANELGRPLDDRVKLVCSRLQ